MNKRLRVWIGATLISMIVLTKTPLLYVLFSLFILGMIPGTHVIIPPAVLLVVYPLLFIAILSWLTTDPLHIGVRHEAARSVPKTTRQKATRRPTKTRPNAAKRRSHATV